MRLSKVLELPELKKRDIIQIGRCRANDAVLAHRGEQVMPFPKLFHLIEDGPDDPDPEVDPPEINSILRRFGYFGEISTISSDPSAEPPSK